MKQESWRYSQFQNSRRPSPRFIGIALFGLLSSCGYQPFVLAPADVAPECTTQNTTIIKPLDVILAVDSTGSMASGIEAVRSSLGDLSLNISYQVSARFGVVDFNDISSSPTNSPLRLVQNLDGDVNKSVSALGGIQASGGGDTPELGAEALFQIAGGRPTSIEGSDHPPIGSIQWNSNTTTTRLVIYTSDAPFHTGRGASSAQAAIAIKDAGIKMIFLYLVRSTSTPFEDFYSFARASGSVATQDLDLNGDGNIDIAAGEPLVIRLSGTGEFSSEGSVSGLSSVITASIKDVISKDICKNKKK